MALTKSKYSREQYECERCGYTRQLVIDLPNRKGWLARCLTRLRRSLGGT